MSDQTNQSKEPKLLPCPFCAETKILVEFQRRGFVCMCGTCMAQTADTYCHDTKEKAIEKWNMRKNY